MGAVANKVLADLGYDPNYKIGGAGVVREGSAVKKPNQDNGYLGNVFNSIKAGVGAVPGMVGGAANQWWKDAQTTGKGIAQFAPNVLFGANTAQKDGKGGGYVPGVANLVAPWASPLFQQQADANSAGKATFLDNALSTPYAQIADINNMIDKNKGKTTAAQHQLYNQELTGIGQNIVDPKTFNMAIGNVASTPFAFGKFQGVGQAGSLLARAEGLLGASKGAQPFIDTIGGTLKTIAKAPLKQELINKPNVEAGINIPGQLASGDYKGAALNAGSFFVPAAISLGGKGIKATTNFIGKNIFDTSGVFDKIVLKSGKSVNQELKALGKEVKAVGDPKFSQQATKMENQLRRLQDLTLQEANGNHNLAAQLLQRYQSSSNKFEKMDLDQFVKEATRHFESRVAVQKLAKTGAFGEKFASGKGVTVGRLTKADKTTIINRVKQSDDMVKEIKLLKKEGVIKNDNLYGQLQDIVKPGNKELALSDIKQIIASNPLLIDGEEKAFKNGYFATYSKNAGEVRNAKDTAEIVAGREAKFGNIGNAVRKVGLSPEAVTAEDNRAVFNKFKNAFTNAVNGVDNRSGNKIYNDLNELADRTLGVTDIRQLSKAKVADELNLTKAQAGDIIKAAKDSYKVLSVQERGLAGKLMDFNLRKNPLAAPYSRVQSIARYEKNPFFRLQENLETRFGVAAVGGKQAKPLTGQYDETIKKLDKGIFTSGYGSEGADSFSGSYSGVGAKLSRDQKANIAATIEKFAGGPDKVDNWLTNPKNADLLNDFKTIVQYPDKGFTSSNLAKMMNIVAFPSRYNLKVTGFAVKQLQKQPAMTQVAIIRGLKDFNDFTKTPEGTKWRADNKEALGLLSYFTPVQPILSVFDSLTGKNKTLGDFGMVGGLPFGVLTRILTGQGVLRDRVPYVDPKTGKVYSDRVPEDLKARAESLLSSVVDTLYTYPGRTAGMETSKKQLTQGITDNISFGQLKGGKYNEIDRSGDVTPEQQKQIDVLKSSQPKGSQTKSPGTFALPTIKRPSTIVPTPISKTKKAKKAKPIAKPIGSFL